YVYELIDGAWEQTDKITASDPSAVAQFGYDVSVSGGTIAAGANLDDEEGTDAGAVYLFRRDGTGNWAETQKVTGSDTAANDEFGSSVSVDGDILAAGARKHNGAG